MPIRNVKSFDLRDRLRQRRDHCIVVHDPHGLLHAILRKVINRRVRRLPILQYRMEVSLWAAGQEDRPCIRVARINMADPVRLFVRTGKLMLFDHVVAVIVDRCAANQARLRAAPHDLAVDIEAGLCVLFANAVRHKLFEIFPRLRINAAVIGVDGRSEIDLRLIDMQEGIGVPLRHFPCLRAAHHIIGERRHLIRIFRKGPYRRKGFKYCHGDNHPFSVVKIDLSNVHEYPKSDSNSNDMYCAFGHSLPVTGRHARIKGIEARRKRRVNGKRSFLRPCK